MRKQKKSILMLGIIMVFLATTLFLLSQILPASERFQLVFDGDAVLDKKTGLIWEQSPDTIKRGWTSAGDYCSNKEVGGRKGWRLPTWEELDSLMDTNESDPALPSGHPFSNVQPFPYWSSSTVEVAFAWVVNLSDGSIPPAGLKTNSNYVWCVQAGK